VAEADEDLIGLLDVLVDDRLLDLDGRVRTELPSEEACVEAAEPGIEENRLVLERDLPAIGTEPLQVDASGTRAAALRRRVGALGDTREQQRLAPVDGGRSQAGREAGPEELSPGQRGVPGSPAESTKHIGASSMVRVC
jgi:hypothetical protein